MKKYAIYFFIFIFFMGLFGAEKYLLFLTNTGSFFIFLLYSFNILFRKYDFQIQNLYKEDKEWVWVFSIALMYDIYSLIKYLLN
jgi:O-antigen ligase